MKKNKKQLLVNNSFSGLIGVSQCDITPAAGIYSKNWGAATTDIATGVHRPLIMTCLTLQTSLLKKPMVIISADLGWWKTGFDEKKLRYGLLESLKLDESDLMFCLSHTHSGPSLSTDDKDKPGGDMIEPYLCELQNKTLKAVNQALSSAQEAILDWRYGVCDLATNRDLQIGDTKKMHIGFNPELSADDTLLVGRVTNHQNNTIAVLVNYACHPTTLGWENLLISPDYVGALREVVEVNTGGKLLFLQGASGDLAPSEQYSGDTTLADKHGKKLGYAVLSTLSGFSECGSTIEFQETLESGAPLALWASKKSLPSSILKSTILTVPLSLKELPSEEELELACESCDDPVEKERLWRKKGIRKSIGNGEQAFISVWIWQIGSAILVGQCNEAYSQYQENVREAFPEYPISIINMANGYIGYLPPKHLYKLDMYPVWQTPFLEGSLELLEKETIKKVNQLIN